MAPGTIVHKTHKFTPTMFTSFVISDDTRADGARGVETGSVAPGAKPPVRQNSFMATGAYVIKFTAGVITILPATPGATRHPFCNRLVTLSATMKMREHLLISFHK